MGRHREGFDEAGAAAFERAVGRELGTARSRAGIEIGAAAEACGVDLRTVAAYEAGDRAVRLGTLYLVAKAAGVAVSDLVRAAERKAGEGLG